MSAGKVLDVLHLDTGREMRGGQWQALLLMQALARRGHRQRLLARAGSPLLDSARAAGLDAAPLRGGLRFPAAAAAANVIHAHDAASHSRAWLGTSRPPLVVSRRVAFPVGRGWLSRRKYAGAARYIAVSKYVARELAFAGVPEERITVIFDGVRLPDLAAAAEQRAEFRRRLSLPGDAFVAGTLTALREKPIQPLLEAAASRPRLHLLIVAPDAERWRLVGANRERPAPGWPPAANVRMLAREPDISSFFYALDVFVHLSESEGLGSAALLAMGHGLPVVASDAGGLPEIVRDGETGLLVQNQGIEVGAALEKLFARPDEARAMGARGRRFVELNATDDIMAERTEQVYLQAISETAAGGPGAGGQK